MRKTLAALTLAAVVGAQTPTAIAGGEPLSLQAQATASAYQLGRTVLIDVTLKNTTAGPISYTLPTPCDSPVVVTVLGAGGKVAGPLPRVGDPGPGRMCAQVLVVKTLQPGELISQRVVWETSEGQIIPGAYTVEVAAHNLDEGQVQPARIPLVITGMTDTETHWAGMNVLQGLRRGFIAGYPDNTFRPQNQVSRGELVKMLVVARGLRPLQGQPSGFADTAGHWVESQGYLAAAVEAGLIHPADYDMTLQPDLAITRQETAALVVRAMAQEGAAMMGSGSVLPFGDKAEVAPWAGGYVMQASAAGVVRGYEDGSFRPGSAVTRAEALTMTLRMVDVLYTRIDDTARLVVDGAELDHAPAILERYDRGLAPLKPLAEAGLVQVSMKAGWYEIGRGDARIRVKAGIPYGITGDGRVVRLEVAPPTGIGGEIYLPDVALQAVGLSARWDFASRTFLVAAN